MTVPEWVRDAVFYQVFPDRFANGDPANDPPNVRPWNEKPSAWGFHGGDLQGLIDRFDYLLDLGVNAIYLNPIFLSASNHRYDTIDYFQIDPKLGDLSVFRALIEKAHQLHVRIVLDGVFNHCGRGFFAFDDVLSNQEHSPYQDWFHIQRFPLNAYNPHKKINYLAWWGHRNLPKFNTGNPGVREYLFSVARYWIEQGADGWRLDVPTEIDDDSFWEAFRSQVKQINPDAFLLGEVWEVNPRFVGERHFDGLMNYPVRDALLDFVARRILSPSEFAKRIEAVLQAYPQAHNFAQYVLLGSHDTERLRTLCFDDDRVVQQAFLFQMGFPGAPAIYYGDEIGMTGGKDPDCRGAFPTDEAAWNHALRDYVRNLIRLRHRLPVLRQGDYATFLADDSSGVYAYVRSLQGESALILLNISDEARSVQLAVDSIGWEIGREVYDAISKGNHQVSGEGLRLSLPPRGGALLYVPT
jgi:cyclomaltodextrinase / maltogenic alpha-amylase / neopullulanase